MRRAAVLVVMLALMGTAAVGVGLAQEPSIPDHPHMLVLGIEIGEVDGIPAVTGWRSCVDLAAGKPVPLHSHHARLHFGPVNDVLFDRAGHAVIGGAPFGPWEGCAGLAAALPILFG